MTDRTTSAVPNPGTEAALAKGCTCPIIDNYYGKGFRGQPGVYVYTAGCPVHSPSLTASQPAGGEGE